MNTNHSAQQIDVTIVANGEPPCAARLQAAHAAGSILIAADGGANACYAAGIVPNLTIGDLDSIAPPAKDWLIDMGAELCLDPDQNVTDLELACQHALRLGAERITILGGLGGRLDHQLGNIMTLFQIPEQVSCTFEDAHQILCLLRTSADLPAKIGQTISVVPILPTTGLRYQGLKYLPQDEAKQQVEPGWLGVCNLATDTTISIEFDSGAVLIILMI